MLSEVIVKFANLDNLQRERLAINALKYYNNNFRKEIIIEKLEKVLKGES